MARAQYAMRCHNDSNSRSQKGILMSQAIALVKEKVQRYLTDMLGSVTIDRDGDFAIRYGSSQIYVRVAAFGEGSVVSVFAPTNYEVPPSAELYRYVAEINRNYVFGKFSTRETDGKVAVSLTHALLGEYLDPDELKSAVGLLASLADQVDDDIKSKFGGRRFHES